LIVELYLFKLLLALQEGLLVCRSIQAGEIKRHHTCCCALLLLLLLLLLLCRLALACISPFAAPPLLR
jgi:hypothetical protein